MSNTDGPAALRQLAGDFELTKAACWNESDTAAIWMLAAAWDAERAQAAADRAALADVRMAHTALNTLFDDAMRERDDLRVKLEEAYKALEVIGTRKDTAEAALAQARALLTELYDDSPCRFDHHGHCQEHNSMTDVCIMRRIAAALSGGAR